MGRLATIGNRIYGDYLMPSRLDEYDKVIKSLLESGYEHITFRDYNKNFKSDNIVENKKYFINRHDIDSDVATAKEFFKIEKKYNVKATYYFRLSTLDFEFMNEIEEYGSEASYHFEEVATYAKKYNIKTKNEILKHLDKIKNQFKKNLNMIKIKMEGVKVTTVCSHGDFANRELGVVNNIITKDTKLREEFGIECETYDEDILDSFDIYISDKPYPIYYTPKSIFNYIGKKNIICMLSHPRQWRTNILINTYDNINRFIEGIQYR
jgi:hypothetical protein